MKIKVIQNNGSITLTSSMWALMIPAIKRRSLTEKDQNTATQIRLMASWEYTINMHNLCDCNCNIL